MELLAYAVAVLGMQQMGRMRAYRRDPTNLIDALIAVGGFGALVWLFLIVPYLRNAELSTAERAIAVAFSLLSIAVCTFTVRLAIGPGARNTSFYLLAVAAFNGIGSDVTTSIGLTPKGASYSWQLPIAAILAGTAFLALGTAALHPSMRAITEPANEPVPDMTRRRLALMTLAVLIAPLALVARMSSEQRWTVPVVVASWVFVSVLVMVRLAGLVRARSRAGAYDRELALVAEELLGADLDGLPATVERAVRRLVGGESSTGPAPVFRFIPAGGVALDEAASAGLSAGRPWIDRPPEELDTGIGTPAMLFAVVVDRQICGLLVIPAPGDVDEEAVQAIARLTREVAMALERAALIAETERRAGERRFKALVEHSRDAVLQLDAAGLVRSATPAALHVFGMADEAVVGQSLASLVEPEHRDALHRLLNEAPGGSGTAIEIRVRNQLEGPVWCELVATDLRDEPTVGGIVVTARTIDERKTAEQRLARSEARFRSLVQHSSDVVAVVDGDFVVSYASPSIARVLGHDHDDMIDREFLLLVHPDDRQRLVDVRSQLDPSGERPSRLELRVRDGREWWRTLDVTITDLRGHSAVQGIVINAHDVSERKELELDLARQAMYDDLTGLANRALFRQRVAEALERHRGGGPEVAVLFLDLNEFKTVNDSMGHSVGDELLAIVAKRLANLLRNGDTAARLGGDEFALVLCSDDRNAVQQVARRVHAALGDPIHVGGREISIAGSVGIAYADEPDLTIGDLLRNADTAMYVAKRRGITGQVEVFDPSMLVSVTERLELMNDLQRVLERDELLLYYQPLVDIRTGTIKGFEALTRWQHPTRGMVSPASFVPLAEEIGQIIPITEWVLDTALRQLAEWNRARTGHAPLTMSVNLSGRHLEVDGAGDMVAAALARHRLDPELVTVELTEGLALDPDSPDLRRRLEAITDLGVRLAADDFGSGYASYANLQRLPYSSVKIDRSLIDGLEHTHGHRARVQIRSIIEMAHGAGMTVVAEGIEGAEQLVVLRELSCDVGQGYYFSRPVPADQISSLLFDVIPAA
ncbi:MAG: putative bifunctional diguanylate cyclase/phosphodiesterase [Acidimicrobiia bacterium]